MSNQFRPSHSEQPADPDQARKRRRTVLIVLAMCLALLIGGAIVVHQSAKIGSHRPGYIWNPVPSRQSPDQVLAAYGPILYELARVMSADDQINVQIDDVTPGRPCFVALSATVETRKGGTDLTPPGTSFDEILKDHGFEEARRGTEPSGRDFTLARRKRGGSAIFEYHWQHTPEVIHIVVPVTKNSCG